LSGLDEFAWVLERIEPSQALSLEIPDVARDQNEAMNTGRRRKREVPAVLILGAQQPRPFLNDGLIGTSRFGSSADFAPDSILTAART
jgi:hypothetical protein